MKHRILCAALAILLLMAPAYAESLSATREGNELNIAWTAEGECTLTVYKNNWPVRVCAVRGPDGGARVPIDGGSYSVRLRTPNGCLTAKAEDATAKPTTQPTIQPIAEPSIVPTSSL